MPSIFIGNVLVFLLCASNPNDAQNAKHVIELHTQSLARIQSIYVKKETWREPSLQSDLPQTGVQAERKKVQVSESWRAGSRERNFTRAYRIISQNGEQEYPDGILMIRGRSDREMRTIGGWDPENPLPLPLQVNPLSCSGVDGGVRCSLATRNPNAVDFGSGDWLGIFEITLGISLAQAAEISEIVLVPSDKPGLIRLEVKAGPTYLTGMKIDLDLQHGHLIRRITMKDGTIGEVEQFTQFGDGIWIPKRLRNSSQRYPMTVEVVDCRVKILSDEELDVNFPEGARVDQPEKGLIHLWGKDGPVKTFSTADFEVYLQQERMALLAKLLQWVVWMSVILLGFFAVYRVLRGRRIAKRTSPVPG